MPRTTRAAAKAQAEHVEPAGLTVAPDGKRDALRSITPNSIEEPQEAERPIDEDTAKKKKSKAKGRKKKGGNNNIDPEEGVCNPHPCPCLLFAVLLALPCSFLATLTCASRLPQTATATSPSSARPHPPSNCNILPATHPKRRQLRILSPTPRLTAM
jgi:hypothetical protein